MATPGGHIAALVQIHRQLVQKTRSDWAEEAHREQHEIYIHSKFAARDGGEGWGGADADAVKLLDVAVLVAGELDRGDGPFADAAFLVGALNPELHGPQRPRG